MKKIVLSVLVFIFLKISVSSQINIDIQSNIEVPIFEDSKSADEFAQASAALPNNIDFWSNYPDIELARAIIARMSHEELFAQILMFGWAGAEPEVGLYRWISRGLGSVKIFGWNTENTKLVAKSVASLQSKAASCRFKIPLFVATDQEGGWVRHIKGETAYTPGNMALGASGYYTDAWYSAYYICKEIKALGINMNFAPAVDLFINHNSSIIGTRSFGEDPILTGVLGCAFAAGSKAAGVIPTAKHFPGHGDTVSDSHTSLPVINIDFKTFENRELLSYKYLIKEDIPAIMSGHLSYPQVDTSGFPASLSKYILTDMLREKLGFKGLIITDDMMMNGAAVYAGSVSNAFKMAIEAGNDIIMSSSSVKLDEALWVNNLALMKKNYNFYTRVRDAAFRVLKAKLTYFKSGNAAPIYPDPESIEKYIPDRDGHNFFLEQACRSITVYKKTNFPIKEEYAGRVLLTGALPAFFEEGKKRYKNSREFKFSYELGPNETEWMCNNILKTALYYDTVIICVSNYESAKIVQQLKDSKKKIIIFSIMSPVHIAGLTWADEILAGYSRSDYTLNALFAALNGEFTPQGTVPFKNKNLRN